MPLQREGLQSFLGVNLRRDRLDLADQEMARCINADLHRQPGVVHIRAGRTAQFSTSLGAAIRRLARHNGVRYQVAGEALYRNQVESITGLSANHVTTLQPFRPLNDTQEWVYVADDALMRKIDEAGTVQRWGIVDPSAAPTTAIGSATGLTGAYRAKYTYARVVDGAVVGESNPSAAGTSRTLADEKLNVTVVASSDAQVTHIRIYRTVAGGTSYLFDQQVANADDTIASSQADSALGAAVDTDNDVPNEMSWVAAFQEHLFLARDAANPHYLWWSKRFREEVPVENFMEIGHPSDPLMGLFPVAGFLGVFTRLTKYRVVGNTTSGFVAIEALSSRGTPAPLAALTTPKGVVFPARDGLWLTNFLEADTELSQQIEGLFSGQTINDYHPINWDRANEMAIAEWKDRLYFSYPTTAVNGSLLAVYSKDTQQWYHYQYSNAVTALGIEEDLDTLVAGGSDGLVYVLEDGMDDAGDDLTLTMEPASRAGGDRATLKLFQYFIVDATGNFTVTFYVDDVARFTATISGTRLRTLLRLPSRLMGRTWRVLFAYAGQEAVAVYGVQTLFLPLQVA